MRIAKLQVQNFKAFYGDKSYEFDFTQNNSAKNIFIYGENGNGKKITALFQKSLDKVSSHSDHSYQQ